MAVPLHSMASPQDTSRSTHVSGAEAVRGCQDGELSFTQESALISESHQILKKTGQLEHCTTADHAPLASNHWQVTGDMARRLRVAIGGLEHETNTYATEYTGLTTRADFSEQQVRLFFDVCIKLFTYP